MKVIGLTGSIAMGKSEVAQVMRSIGIAVFDSDAEVHKFYDSGQGVALISKLIPAAVINGKVDRPTLSAHVLGNPKLLSELEKHVHAEIRKRRDAFLAGERQQGKEFAALDIPLLFETGAEKQVDISLVVSSNPDLQRQRALARSGMSPEKFQMILTRQMPDQEKRARADYVVENNGTKDELRTAVLTLIDQIKKSGETK